MSIHLIIPLSTLHVIHHHVRYGYFQESEPTRGVDSDLRFSFQSSQRFLHHQYRPQHPHHSISMLKDEQDRTSDRKRHHPFLGRQHINICIICIVARCSSHCSTPEEHSYHTVPAVREVCAEEVISDLYHDPTRQTAGGYRERRVEMYGCGVEYSTESYCFVDRVVAGLEYHDLIYSSALFAL